MSLRYGALLIMLAGAAQAVELTLPTGARQMVARDTEQDRFSAPIAPFSDGMLPVREIEGTVARSAWRFDIANLTPLQLIAPLRLQLEAAGYRTVLDCVAQTCGGYDFRFATEVLPAPNMYVNLRNYHALTALRGQEDAPDQAVTILASTSSGASFVQIIQAGAGTQAAGVQATSVALTPEKPAGNLSEVLARDGRIVLGALDFDSGTSALGAGPFRVLVDLAKVLRAQPDLRIALVGHTDNIGDLDSNIALSVSRARAVRQRLLDVYAIAPDRLEVHGMGYLAPATTNQTETGREANRRVEAVVLSE